MSGAPKLFPVPAGTKVSACRSCQKPIYWVENPATQRRSPVDCAPDGCQAPTATDEGRGVSHFGTCPDAAQWRRGKGAA